MSLAIQLGERGNLLEAGAKYAHLLKLESPVLSDAELDQIRQSGFETADLSTLFELSQGPDGLQRAVTALCQKAAEAVRAGKKILILSDRSNKTGSVSLSEDYTYIPPLLAIGAVHHHLIRQGTRAKVGLVLESGEPREVLHFSLLIGYGAGVINPYLAFDTIDEMIRDGSLPKIDHSKAIKNYVKAVGKGVMKVMSKMGISTAQSYCGAPKSSTP